MLELQAIIEGRGMGFWYAYIGREMYLFWVWPWTKIWYILQQAFSVRHFTHA